MENMVFGDDQGREVIPLMDAGLIFGTCLENKESVCTVFKGATCVIFTLRYSNMSFKGLE